MSYHKSSSSQNYGGNSRRQPQYLNAQQIQSSMEYHSPSYEFYGGHAMSDSGSLSSHSSYVSGHWNPQTSADAPYGLLSPADSPPESYFSTPSQLDDIELKLAPPVKSQRTGTCKRSNKSDSPTLPSAFPCLYPDCPYTSQRAYDLKRHMNRHFKIKTYPCNYTWCGRNERPFTRQDHLTEHIRTVHLKDIPKRGGRKEKMATDA